MRFAAQLKSNSAKCYMQCKSIYFSHLSVASANSEAEGIPLAESG